MPQPTGPQAGPEAAVLPPVVANVESARCTAALAQLGQTIGLAPAPLRINFSKRSPQLWQIYS